MNSMMLAKYKQNHKNINIVISTESEYDEGDV